MGTCCLPFSGHEDSEENAMESLPLYSEGNRSHRMSRHSGMRYHPGFGRIFKGSEAELIAAGWPPWMVEDAGKSLKGWLPRKEKYFQKLEKIGEGTYSHVYRVLDLEQNNLVTVKRFTA